jgi:ribosomal protein S18 acetylase RimI-like enzyme
VSEADLFESFSLNLPVVIRTCRVADLRPLEWSGAYSDHRYLIAEAFERQESGQVVMLVADIDGFPAGQAWIDVSRKRLYDIGEIWALRVHPLLRGRGIGTQLLLVAERIIREHELVIAELGVEVQNTEARRLYDRLGYEVVGSELVNHVYETPSGRVMRSTLDLIVMRKPLRHAQAELVEEARN